MLKLFFFYFRLGSDVEKLFPFQLMQEHFQKFARLALLLSSIMLPILITENDDETTTNVNDVIYSNIIEHSELNDRLRDIIIDMVQLGYI